MDVKRRYKIGELMHKCKVVSFYIKSNGALILYSFSFIFL